jgi:hypothetical protein
MLHAWRLGFCAKSSPAKLRWTFILPIEYWTQASNILLRAKDEALSASLKS